MPDLAAYTLTTLIFLIFGTLAYGELRMSHKGGPPLLSWYAGLILVMMGVRLAVSALDFTDGFDQLLMFGVLLLIAFTVMKALIEGSAEGPSTTNKRLDERELLIDAGVLFSKIRVPQEAALQVLQSRRGWLPLGRRLHGSDPLNQAGEAPR